VKNLMLNAPCVAVIILHYEGEEILSDCLEALFKSEYENFDAILVDNGSNDGSIQFVRAAYSNYTCCDRLKVLRSPENLGFVMGNNLGLQYVLRASKYKYVVLLNDDTIVDPNWLKELVNVADKDSDIGALQPKLKSLREPSFFEYNGACGGMLDVYGVPFCRGRIFDLEEEDRGQYDKTAEMFWASGAVMFMRVEAIRKAGLLDEIFYAHMEEIDLGWRLRLLGYKIFCVPNAVVYHVGGATELKEKFFLKHRNNLIVMMKNYSMSSLLYYFPGRMILDTLSALFFVFEGNSSRAFCVFKAYFWILKNLKAVFRARSDVQARRKVSDDEIVGALAKGNIAVQYYLLGRKCFMELHNLPQKLTYYVSKKQVTR
jgi:GT2 family glycosyltransferase